MYKVRICPKTLALFYDKGETIEVMAEYFDCNEKTIRRRAKKLGLQHPFTPQRTQAMIYAKLDKMNAVERYEQGESLMALAQLCRTTIDTLRSYLKRKGVKIRTRVEQVAVKMAKHGTRFPDETQERLYLYKRDAYGLVPEIRTYENNNPNPIVKRTEF